MNVLTVLSGNPPSVRLLKTEMRVADCVIAVDGGFNVFSDSNLKPDLILGDMDSIKESEALDIKSILLADQDQTDLQKTLTYILKNHSPKSLVLLGAGGLRTDHLLHNLLICASVHPTLKITIKNELPVGNEFTRETIQRITPQSDFDLLVRKGDLISILPIGNFSDLSSEGLKWEITRRSRSDGFMSQSNRAMVDDPKFIIGSGYAYIAVYQ